MDLIVTGAAGFIGYHVAEALLARGELHTIGATTLDEYRKYIEKDAALERGHDVKVLDTLKFAIDLQRGVPELFFR